MHPLLHLLASEPHLLADHVQAYGELAEAELERLSRVWKKRAVLGAAGAVLGLLALMTGGTALMLYGALPAGPMPAPWLLVAVPLALASGSLACLWAARSGAPVAAFAGIRHHIRADIAVLREASQP